MKRLSILLPVCIVLLTMNAVSLASVTVRYGWDTDTKYNYHLDLNDYIDTDNLDTNSITSVDVGRYVQSYNDDRFQWEITTSFADFDQTTIVNNGTPTYKAIDDGDMMKEKIDSRGFVASNIVALNDFEDVLEEDPNYDPNDIKSFLSGLWLTELPDVAMNVNDTFTVDHTMGPESMTNPPTINIQWKLLDESETHLSRDCVKFEITSPDSTFSDWSGSPDPNRLDGREIDDMDVTTFDLNGTLWFDNTDGIIVEWDAVVNIEGSVTVDYSGNDDTSSSSFDRTSSINYKLTGIE